MATLLDHVTRIVDKKRLAKMSKKERDGYIELFSQTDKIIEDMENFKASPKPDRKLSLAEKLELQGYTAPIGAHQPNED